MSKVLVLLKYSDISLIEISYSGYFLILGVNKVVLGLLLFVTIFRFWLLSCSVNVVYTTYLSSLVLFVMLIFGVVS
jgi:hypothetical protein